MSKIFVSITSLDDKETIPTVLDAIEKASDPSRVVVGVAIAASNNKIFNQLKKIYKKYPLNIRSSYTKVTKDNQITLSGVGKGRLRARALYDNEDYLLQIDSHTMFEEGWDEKLISIYNDAIRHVKTEKVIITAYAGKYHLDKNGRRIVIEDDTVPGENKKLGFLYNTFLSGHSRYDIVPSWIVNESEVVRSMPNKFVPSLKFNANFAFGSKDFAEDIGISDREIFFEEELIQTMELMKRGFSLVHPNIESAIVRHLYADYGTDQEIVKEYKRTNLATEFYRISFDYQKSLAIKNYLSYLSDTKNKEVVESYQRYAGVNLYSSYTTRTDPVPTSWKLDIFGDWPYNG